jgi:hypothetical protein
MLISTQFDRGLKLPVICWNQVLCHVLADIMIEAVRGTIYKLHTTKHFQHQKELKFM